MARFTLQVQKHFKNRKKWQKKVIPIDAPLDIQIAILITLTKILADSPRKLRSIPNFFLLCSYPQKPFYRTSLWDTIWQPASVFQQMNEILSSKRENKYTKEKISQNFFPASCSFGGFECCILTHPDQRFCRKDGKLSLKCQFFFLLLSRKSFSRIVLRSTFVQPAPIYRQEDKISRLKFENKKKQNRSFLKESLFSSANWSFRSGECWFVNYNEIKGRKVHFSNLN